MQVVKTIFSFCQLYVFFEVQVFDGQNFPPLVQKSYLDEIGDTVSL